MELGKLYFTLLGAASIVVAVLAFLSLTGSPSFAAGVALGITVSEAIVLPALPVLMRIYRIAVESKLVVFRHKGVQVKVEKEPLQVRFVKKMPILSNLTKKMEERIRADVVKGGMKMDPYTFAATYSFYSVVLGALFVPTALVLTVIISPVLLALLAVPAIMFYTPVIAAKNTVQERKESLNDELPFFTLLASIMQSAGRSLYETMRSVIGKQILPAMELEARLLQKSVGFGKEIVSAIDDLASTHPDENFRHFLYGYTSVLKSGGDVVLYLSDRVKEYLAMMRFRWQSYAEKAGSIGEMLTIMFVLLPLLLVVGAVTMPPEMVAEIAYVAVGALPMIAIVMYFMIRVVQPKTHDIIGGDVRLGIIGAVAGAGIGAVLGQIWLAVAMAGAVGGALYGLPVRAQLREIRLTEQALPEFLRNIAEYRKIGYNMKRAIIETSKQAKFNPVFDSILSRIVAQLNLGVRLGEVKVAIRSWLGRTTLFILDQIGESGGGTPANIEDLYNFISSYNRLRREATASVKLYRLIGFGVPIAIPIVVKIIGSIVSSFGSSTGGFLGGGIASLQIVNATVALVSVASAGAIAFTMGKAVDFTAKNTLNMTITFALAVVAVSLAQYLPAISIFPSGF